MRKLNAKQLTFNLHPETEIKFLATSPLMSNIFIAE